MSGMDFTEKAKEMAAIVKEIEDVERAKREVTKEYRDQLTELWKRLEHLSGDVESEQMSIEESLRSVGVSVLNDDGSQTPIGSVADLQGAARVVERAARRTRR